MQWQEQGFKILWWEEGREIPLNMADQMNHSLIVLAPCSGFLCLPRVLLLRASCLAPQGSAALQVAPELTQQCGSFPVSTVITMHQTVLSSPFRWPFLTHQIWLLLLGVAVCNNSHSQQPTPYLLCLLLPQADASRELDFTVYTLQESLAEEIRCTSGLGRRHLFQPCQLPIFWARVFQDRAVELLCCP